MNDTIIKQIFANYIEKFDHLNSTEHKEYFKWQVAKRFRQMMDEALAATANDLQAKLYKVKQLTGILTDNSQAYPFNALVQYSKREPEVIREMFSDLYFSNDALKDRIYNFLTRSHNLRSKYFPGSTRYKNDVHSVSVYLAMYDPDHHFIYRPTESREFADYVEFYDDWDSGDTVEIDVYYRMCNQLVEAINRNEELLATNARRFAGEFKIDPETLHADSQKHILAWDLIYCSSSIRYNLLYGIPDSKKTPTERQAIRERQQKAEQKYWELSDKLNNLVKQDLTFEEVKRYLLEVFSVSSTVIHKTFGNGEVTDMVDDNRSGLLISVLFDKVGTKRFVLHTTIKGGFLFPTSGQSEYIAKVEAYKDRLRLFESTKMESLQKSIVDTEQAIKALGKTPEISIGNNIQQNFTITS